MSYEITGTLITRSETETKGESFRVRTFGIKVNDGSQYDNFASFQLTQDRVSLVDDLKKGDEVKVHFDVRGREWNGKILTNLNAWRIERVSTAEQPAAEPQPAPQPAKEPAAADEPLPF